MIGHDILKSPLITVEPDDLLGHAASLITPEDAVAVDVLHARRTSTPSRTRVLETPAGTLLLRDFCPPSLVGRLRVESGLQAFTHVPDREHALLLDIASSPDCALTLAYTPAGEIVGQVTLALADGWWEGVENLYEVALEVSSHWRGRGVARQLLAFALELDALEEVILFAMGFSWHWDMEGLHISTHGYRVLVADLFAAQGFQEYPTAEPDISMDPNNFLLARIGQRVDQRVAAQFFRRLRGSPYALRW
ncbi:MAG TPA: GNAT family N-acetyltransferase [Ktedonobacteraceae bacterium]